MHLAWVTARTGRSPFEEVSCNASFPPQISMTRVNDVPHLHSTSGPDPCLRNVCRFAEIQRSLVPRTGHWLGSTPPITEGTPKLSAIHAVAIDMKMSFVALLQNLSQ
jgi:hypothetical protein